MTATEPPRDNEIAQGDRNDIFVVQDEDGRQLHVEAAVGLNRPSHHVRYAVGEGVIGKVVESGKPIIVPRISREPSR